VTVEILDKWPLMTTKGPIDEPGVIVILLPHDALPATVRTPPEPKFKFVPAEAVKFEPTDKLI